MVAYAATLTIDVLGCPFAAALRRIARSAATTGRPQIPGATVVRPHPSQLAALERSDELHGEILTDPGRFRVLTGDRLTGRLHIGHYLGTFANRVRLQDLGVEVFVLIADYQVMTDQRAGHQLGVTVRGVVADYLAAGIDPHRTTT